jgi:hypothetical protein
VYVTSPDVPLSGTCAYAGIARGGGGKLRLRWQLQELPSHQQLLQQALPEHHQQLLRRLVAVSAIPFTNGSGQGRAHWSVMSQATVAGPDPATVSRETDSA